MKYKGQLEGFSKEVVEKMLENQVLQGNVRDVEIFEDNCQEDVVKGGFDWDITKEGDDFWEYVISDKNFDLFFKKYPKSVKNDGNRSSYPFDLSKNTRSYNVGKSDYAKHKIQPWDIWLEYDLNPFDADIVKRVLRNKEGEDRELDYEKMIHICNERIRQIRLEK